MNDERLLKYWYKLVIKIEYQLWYGSVSREREGERIIIPVTEAKISE